MGMLSYVKNEINGHQRERSRDQIRLGSLIIPEL